MPDNILQKLFQPSARGKVRWIFVLIILLVLGAGLVDAGQYYNKAIDKFSLPLPHAKEIPFHLGLDLLGGTHLVYEADVSQISENEKNSAVEGVRDVIERRVNVFGVSEPIVQVNRTTAGDYRVIVELAGIQDVSEAIQMIGETPLLEFKEESDQARELTEEERNQMNDFNIEAESRAEEVLGKVLSGGDFAALAADYNQDENTAESKGDFGWIIEKENPEIFNLAKNIEPGKTSEDLIKTSLGYEIIKVEDKRIKKDPFTEKEEKEIKAALEVLPRIKNFLYGQKKRRVD